MQKPENPVAYSDDIIASAELKQAWLLDFSKNYKEITEISTRINIDLTRTWASLQWNRPGTSGNNATTITCVLFQRCKKAEVLVSEAQPEAKKSTKPLKLTALKALQEHLQATIGCYVWFIKEILTNWTIGKRYPVNLNFLLVKQQTHWTT